jgi:hypothetical protein
MEDVDRETLVRRLAEVSHKTWMCQKMRDQGEDPENLSPEVADHEPRQALERLGIDARAAQRDEIRNAVRTEVMDVEQALDEYQFPVLSERRRKDLSQSIRRESGPSRAAEVEKLRARIPAVQGPRPQCPDAGMLIAPGSAEPSGPAPVRKQTGLLDLARRVTHRR